MSPNRTLKTEELTEFLAHLFTATGVYAYDATDCAHRILEADVLGEHAHGLTSVARHVEAASNGDIDPRAMVMTESETAAVAFLNGNQGMGHAAGTKAVTMAVEKAKAVGTGTIVVSNSQDFGSPAVYARLIALSGCVGYVTTSTGEKPSFTETLDRHEFAWAIPNGTDDVLFSIGASEPNDNGQAMALGTTLSLMHAILTGGLAGGKFPAQKTRGSAIERTEHYIHAIDPNQFAGSEKFQKRLGDGLEAIGDGTRMQHTSSQIPSEVEVSAAVVDMLSELHQKYPPKNNGSFLS